jgi:hypothetical protein
MKSKTKLGAQGVLKSFNLNSFINFILTVLAIIVKGRNFYIPPSPLTLLNAILNWKTPDSYRSKQLRK